MSDPTRHDSSQFTAQNTEAAILRAACADVSLFAPLYRRYAPRLYAYCLRRTGHPQDAEDIASQIITRALKSLPTYEGGPVAAWLFAIARHTLADHYRQQYRHPLPAQSLEQAQDVPDRALSPLECVIRGEQNARVRDVLQTLPEDDQELIALRITAGLSASEIGAILGCSAGAVRVRLHRVFRRLRALMPQDVRSEERLS